MTSLGVDKVQKYKGWVIGRAISGDLSHSWGVYSPAHWAGSGVPMSFPSIGIAKKFVDSISKKVSPNTPMAQSLAWKFYEVKKSGSNWRFGYLKGADAKKYAKAQFAYGEYVEKLRGQK